MAISYPNPHYVKFQCPTIQKPNNHLCTNTTVQVDPNPYCESLSKSEKHNWILTIGGSISLSII